ncbi:MAG TPA: septum site-determining protein MinC [Stellaceae bacterium]|nr:septum site-determining protein MinC [Stellaceae bacterium]
MSINRLEGSIFTILVLSVGDPHDPALETALADQIGRNPDFFAGAPVVLDLAACLACTDAEDFAALKLLLRRHGLTAVGVQNASALQKRAIEAAELALFPATTGRREAARAEAAKPRAVRTRLVTQPVRSGTQIYAKGGDLVVAAPVSAGAELIADGNVHVYGPLRGRAIAGAVGDRTARIFVQHLEAELLAIAGRYMVSEAIAQHLLKQPAQVALVEDSLRIMPGF